FDGVLENSFDAVSSRDFALEVVSNLNILMLNLSRIMEDLIIWLSSEYGFFTLPDELAFPSSAMPNKKNPCILELTRARTGRVFSSLAQLSMVCKAVPSGYVRDLQETKPPLIEAIETTREAVRIVRIILESIKENRERIRSLTEPSIIALDIAERIVEEASVPFRLAHRLVGEMVRLSIKTGRRITSFNEDDLRMVSLSVLGRDMSSLLAGILKEADTSVLVSKRVSLGAGSPEADKMMLAARRNVLQECFSRLSLMIQRDREARMLLEDSVSRLVEGFSFSKD
ncbi:MAG: lyase family protein, partial [Thermoproteota archaeon]